MTDRMDDDFVSGHLVEHQVWIRRSVDPADGWIVRLQSDARVRRQQVENSLNASMDTRRTLRRMDSDVIENGGQIGKSRTRIAQPHRPCLAHTARTSSSVANSPRAASALDLAIAARSSGVSGTGGASSVPASCMMARAI